MLTRDRHTEASMMNDLIWSRNRKIMSAVNEVLTAHVSDHAMSMRDLSAEVSPLIGPITNTLDRGKRIRAQFCAWGAYGATGGDLTTGVAEMGAAIELFHLAALIHDDVMDNSDTRRGLPTVHRLFSDEHARRGRLGDSDHHGSAVAILIGDMCLSWSDDLATMAADHLDINARRTIRTMWSQMRNEAYAGQYLDMLSQTETATSPARTELVLQLKSAKYTISQPLRLGGALAGADDELLSLYDQIGLTAGEAFQLRDDLLGVFGDPEVTGKPVSDDIREGKRTRLITEAQARADASQMALLRRCLGNPAVDDTDLAALRSMFITTGAEQAIESRIDELTDHALQIVGVLPVDDLSRTALAGLVERCVRRTS